MQRPITLIDVHRLRITERTDPERELEVVRELVRAGVWSHPISVERRLKAIMDGHHRYRAALLLGLSRIPCVLYDYSEVRVIPRRIGVDIRPDEILRRARERDPYPAKTTRHVFPDLNLECRVALDELRDNAFEGRHRLVWCRAEPSSLRFAAGAT